MTVILKFQGPYGEQSCYSNHPRAHTVHLGRMTTRKKIPPPLATLLNPVLLCLSGHSDPIVLEPFHVTLWYSGVPRTPRFHRILKVILEMAFSAHCTQIWKWNRISMTIISRWNNFDTVTSLKFGRSTLNLVTYSIFFTFCTFLKLWLLTSSLV